MNGLINPPPPDTRQPLYIARKVQYQLGELTFCDCVLGQGYKSYLAGLATKYVSDADELAQAKERYAEEKQRRLWENAGIPPKYATYTLQSYLSLCGSDKGKAEAIKAITTMLKDTMYQDKFGLVLWGEPGVGKTGALSPLFVHLLKNGCSGLWVQYNELLAQLRDFESGNVDERMKACQTVKYLLIDDLGDPMAERSATDYARDCLFRIIDHRKNHSLPILATSNLNLDGLEQQFHKRIVQRLTEVCNVIEVKGKVLRK
jgi:DNA replication protein DnaC